MQTACPSTEQIQEWWNRMQDKRATRLYTVADHGIYRLRAFTEKRQKCGEFSLGIKDRRLAQRIANSLSDTLDDNSIASTINKYIEIKLRHAQTCHQGKYALSSLAESTERSIKTVRSRLNAHLLPFCKERHITDINDMYRCENIRAYMDQLYGNVAIGDTARSIMASTLTFLRWFDGKKEISLINGRFNETLKGWRSFFGFKRSRPKPFLTSQQIQSILCYDYQDDTTKALILFPLICGLRANEVINLRWRDLHASEGNLDVLVAKGGTIRKAQYPKMMQGLLNKIQQSRRSQNLPGDYIFDNDYRRRHPALYKAFVEKTTGISGKDTGSNCLRRSGSNLIESYQHGLADKQLGHSVCTKVTQQSYIDNNNYDDVNFFWDTFHQLCMKPDTVVGVEKIRQMAMKPENVIDFFKLDREAM